MAQPEAFGNVSELGEMSGESLAATLMKQAAARAARERQEKWITPKRNAWESPRGVIMPAPPPVSWNAPSFTTSNTTPANYYNAAATASGAK